MQDTSIALLPLASQQAARPTSSVYQQVRQHKSGPSARRLQQKNVLPCVLMALGLLCCSVSAFVLSSIFLFDTDAPTTLVLPTTHGGHSQIVQLVDDARLRKIVSQTGGRYFVRDWPLWLGWNNIRYILEASLLQAELLNRTLVIPSHLVGRACEHHYSVCADWAPMVNRGQALGSGQWDELPKDEQWGWLLPINLFIDLEHLQSEHNVITTTDFLHLNKVDLDKETIRGSFSRSLYLPSSSNLTYQAISAADYDGGLVRVDRLPPSKPKSRDNGDELADLETELKGWFGKELARDWDELKRDFRQEGEEVEDFELRMRSEGVLAVETYAEVAGMDFTKAMVSRAREAVLEEGVKGWIDDYCHVKADVFHLEGETHNGRKAGQLRFTSSVARDSFAWTVLASARPPRLLVDLADQLSDRMTRMVDGRAWLGGHVRRMDFKNAGFVMEKSAEKHIERVKDRLGRGRELLEVIFEDGSAEPYDVPNDLAPERMLIMPPPLRDDPFWIATDERNTTTLDLFRSHSAILIKDLLTPADRQHSSAWCLLFTDVLGVLEQEVLARAGFMYGHSMSSWVGGVLNRRAALGKDRRLALAD